jgi:hypothetical protein
MENKPTCISHIDIKMCTSPQCKKTTTGTLCIAHQKELERDKLREKPFIPLRVFVNAIAQSYFVIKSTQVVFDPALNVIVGYLDDSVLKNECTPEVQTCCDTFHVRFHMY